MEARFQSYAEFSPPSYLSYHTSYLVSIKIYQHVIKKPFKFYNIWARHDRFLQLFEEVFVDMQLDTTQYRLKLK